jgi:hypothetical protein
MAATFAGPCDAWLRRRTGSLRPRLFAAAKEGDVVRIVRSSRMPAQDADRSQPSSSSPQAENPSSIMLGTT